MLDFESPDLFLFRSGVLFLGQQRWTIESVDKYIFLYKNDIRMILSFREGVNHE